MLRNWALALRPTLSLDFLAGLNDSRITYSGGTNGTVVNSAGVITPVTRTNLLTYSQEFDNAAWTKSATTVTANATTSPDGTANADKLVEDSSTGLHRISQGVSKAASAITYTQTLYVKAGERSIIQVIFSDGGGFALGHFDVANGIKDTPIVSGWTAASSTITDAGNGYYRVSLTATSTAAASVSIIYGICTGTIGAPVQSYTGNGTSGMYPWGAQLEAGSSATAYIPTTTAAVTVTDSGRFDYDPVTLAAKGLLVEEARTNLCLRSEDFTNASWQTAGTATVTANTTVSPDGTQNADTVTANAADSIIYQQIAVSASTTYTGSFYIKAATNTTVTIYILTTGFAVLGSQVCNVTTQWQRFSVTAATGVNTAVLLSIGGGYTFSSPEAVIPWGAQLEAGSFPTSYIPTTSASVTRTADSAVMTGTNFSSWYNQSEGTFVFAGQSDNALTYSSPEQYCFEVGDGGATNSMRATRVNAAPRWYTGNGTFDVGSGSWADANVHKFAASYAADNIAACFDGGSVTTDATATIPTVTQIGIGRYSGAVVNLFNGHIRSITYYPSRLSNEQLQALTS